MHVTVIFNTIPNDNTAGAALTMFSLVYTLKQEGHTASAVLVLPSGNLKPEDAERLKKFNSIADDVRIVASPLFNFSIFRKFLNKFSFSLKNMYPEFLVRDKVADEVRSLAPDVVVMCHFNSMAAGLSIVGIPKFGLVGDPNASVIKQRFLYGLRHGSWKHILLLPFFVLLYIKGIIVDVRLLKKCDALGAFSPQHAEDYRRWGLKKCAFYRTPTVDPFENDPDGWKKRIDKQDDKFTIFLLGHLQGMVTLTGIELFANEILPRLKDALGEDKFVVDIVGRYFETLPKRLKKLLATSCVRLTDFLPSLTEQFKKTDIFLVPTTINLGMRVRAVTAMSYGSLILLHRINLIGMPDLVDGKDCLAGSSGAELAQTIINCYNHKYDEKNLRASARAKYEQYYKTNVAANAIIKGIAALYKQSNQV